MTYIAPKNEVDLLLSEVNRIIFNPSFDLIVDFDLMLYDANKLPSHPNTSKNTLISLDLSVRDVALIIGELSIEEYSHCMIDNKPSQLTPFYVFFKEIQDKLVYIKIKIRSNGKFTVFCRSFHYDDFPNDAKNFPYR